MDRNLYRKDDFDVICFSSQLWDDPMWTNKQHIMNRLSERHRILYLDPAGYSVKSSVRNFIRNGKFNNSVRMVKSNLWVSNLLRIYDTEAENIKQKIIARSKEAMALMKLKRLIKRLKFGNTICWIYQPEAVRFIDRLEEMPVLYDCVDNYIEMPVFRKNKERIKYWEEILLNRADLVVTSSKNLYEEKKQHNNNTFLVPNVGDAEHFKHVDLPSTRVAGVMRNLIKPVIGFVGAVDAYKVDFDLVCHVAGQRPNWSIVLIGPVGVSDSASDTSVFSRFPNIRLLGYRPYHELPSYIKGFDVCMIPYRLNEYTRSCFPIKFHEFLASGKPVVVTNLPALEEYRGTIIMAEGKEGFIKGIEAALSEDSYQKKRQRITLAENNSWEKRISSIETLIAEKIMSK